MAHATIPISQATTSRALSSREPSSGLNNFASLWAHTKNESQDTSNLGDFGELWRFLSGEKEKWCNAGSTNLADMESILTSNSQPAGCKQPPLLPHSSSSEYSSEEEALVADLKAVKKKVEGYVVLTVDKGNKKAATKKGKKNKKAANAQEAKPKGTENVKTNASGAAIKKVNFNDLYYSIIPSSNHKPTQESTFLKEVQEEVDKPNGKSNPKFKIPIPIGISEDPIHVFIDNSNILAGFVAYYRQQQFLRRTPNSQPVLGKKTKPMLEYDALFTILERGRNIARRVLVASSPLYQQLDKAEDAGYEVSVLKRVKRSVSDDNTQQLDNISDYHQSNAFEMEKEQCVDELIHLKILESLLDYHAPATLVLASGDGKDADIRHSLVPRFTIRSHSSSSSSNSTKRITAPATPQKKELSFVHVNQIRPRDLAQITFYALDRPLLSFGNEQTQNIQQEWEEEDFEEESLSSSHTNSLSITLTPFYPTQSTIPMTPAEQLSIVNKFLDGVVMVEGEEIAPSIEGEKENSSLINSQEQSTTNFDERLERKRKANILYLTNIMQKRRLKMNKHKHKKLRKRQRALRKRLGK
ncbi:11688_t:CDS:2 [Acaulospora colombiana]|uniref:11688_t:CDS:1 n=1 Tax=Acaulospora colombiana TaxID=27376 RepID=A0ACA9K975_9GLOM|nr:11688_t:CDS:2 [Acaulospora colombiana]